MKTTEDNGNAFSANKTNEEATAAYKKLYGPTTDLCYQTVKFAAAAHTYSATMGSLVVPASSFYWFSVISAATTAAEFTLTFTDDQKRLCGNKFTPS